MKTYIGAGIICGSAQLMGLLIGLWVKEDLVRTRYEAGGKLKGE